MKLLALVTVSTAALIAATLTPVALAEEVTVTAAPVASATTARDCSAEMPTPVATTSGTPSPTAVPTAAALPTSSAAPSPSNNSLCRQVALRLAEKFGVSYGEVLAWKQSGYGFGEIAIAYSLLANTADQGTTIDEIFALRQSGMGWGQIAHEYDVDLKAVGGAGKGPKGKIADSTTDAAGTKTGASDSVGPRNQNGGGNGHGNAGEGSGNHGNNGNGNQAGHGSGGKKGGKP